MESRANFFTNRGDSYQFRGDLGAALDDYNAALRLDPKFALAYNNRAAVHLHLKHYDKAWADLRRCRELGGVPPAGLVEALVKASGRSE